MHFAALQVKEHRAPLRLLAAPRVRVFVKRRAVEPAKAMRIPREVSGHPIQDYTNACTVACVHQRFELLRRPIARGDGIIPRDLIPPAVIQRIFAQGHQLHMRVAHVHQIIHKFKRKRFIIKPGTPGAKVHLVNAHGGLVRVILPACLHMRRIAPFIAADIPNNGCRLGPVLAVKRKRVRLVDQPALFGLNCVFVGVPDMRDANAGLPYARCAAGFHGVGFRVPSVKASHNAHRARIRRPHGKAERIIAVFRAHAVAAERTVCVGGLPLIEQVKRDFIQISVHKYHLGSGLE